MKYVKKIVSFLLTVVMALGMTTTGGNAHRRLDHD